ncbi:MAG: hypothetical protein J6A27_07115 [Bacteroidales bacterium]|nr:hypothetical protein [Bacteroidales bacterium]
MEVVRIYGEWLYSIQFDEEDLNEYVRIFKQWHNLDYLEKFFCDNAEYIDSPFWKNAGLHPDEPEISAQRVLDEANGLEEYICKLVENMNLGIKPDFDEYFHFLGGKYKCLWTLEPMKSYGTGNPSLLRLYAIKIDKNCYLIVCGGIKLGTTIQNSPVLKDEVFKKIDKVLQFLRANGIEESDDF